MGSCKSKADKNIEKKPEPQTLELKVEKRPLVELQDKITYEGEWLGDNKHGYGIQRWPDGAVFEGNFVNGTANGYGVFIHTDGDRYEGDWQNDRAHGYGTYTHSDGSKYVGEWKNDKKHGKAIESWVDGSHFEGNYAYGLKQGFGKFSWHDGSRYIGNFDANQINGYGIYYWNDGRVYTGCWLKNHMFGFGKFDWTDRRCYEGQYINDKKDGDGKFTWPDGRAYIGQWKNGKQHGIGIFYNIKREGKVGEWRDGSRLRWIKSCLENGELIGEALALREEYSKQREELLKSNDLYESYKKLPKNDLELQQMRIAQKFDECLSALELTSKDEALDKTKESEKVDLNTVPEILPACKKEQVADGQELVDISNKLTTDDNNASIQYQEIEGSELKRDVSVKEDNLETDSNRKTQLEIPNSTEPEPIEDSNTQHLEDIEKRDKGKLEEIIDFGSHTEQDAALSENEKLASSIEQISENEDQEKELDKHIEDEKGVELQNRGRNNDSLVSVVENNEGNRVPDSEPGSVAEISSNPDGENIPEKKPESENKNPEENIDSDSKNNGPVETMVEQESEENIDEKKI